MNNYPYNNQGSGYSYNTQYNADPQYSGQAPQPEMNPQPPKQKKKVWPVVTAAVSGVVAGALAFGAFALPALQKEKNNQAQDTAPSASAAVETETQAAESASADLGGNAFQIDNANNPVPEIAENASKSVVGVTLYNKSYVSGREPLEEKISAGTGFVISSDGLIMTNHHVVEGGTNAKITTADGTEYDAEIVGSDPNTEVAVLRVEGLDLPALPIGDSSQAKTGELVVAIGNPIRTELSGTVTVGYLSGTNRLVTLSSTGEQVEMLQIDAAINPGNSGGPLLNANGEVIGINTMKTLYAGMDSYGNAINAEGIGFAIPISSAMDIAEQIVENGSVPLAPKPGVGFTYQPVSAEDAQMWGVPQGAMIANVIPGSPAAQAGIRQFDVIIMLDGVDLTTGAELPSFEGKQVGDTVTATVWRNGQTADIEMTLADLNSFGE